jgi:hypothetical protein
MRNFVVKIRTVFALGLLNIARVFYYRLAVRLGINPVRRIKANVLCGPFFLNTSERLPSLEAPKATSWLDTGLLFSYLPLPLGGNPPDWMVNFYTGNRFDSPSRDWWQISDFSVDSGDIKLIWELSRMDWVLSLAQAARDGDVNAREKLDSWLRDWCRNNPPYKGPNWKCGQEASIRIIHLVVAAMFLGQDRAPSVDLISLIELHLKRIAPTIQYAIAQDNNHGTSEAAALFIGGSMMASLGRIQGKNWEHLGRKWLENRADQLIGDKGSFSQYSLNYHRLMLDTFAISEIWRRNLSLPSFSPRFYERMLGATQWLYHMIDPETGDGPNIGANDGALLLPISDAPYRDYRPSVQLAMALFNNEIAYQDKSLNAGLLWLGVPLPNKVSLKPGDYIADDGGFAILRRDKATIIFRYPRFRFRPSQADALHLDLSLNGENLLRDGGTYGYNTDFRWMKYFSGTESHNTIQFDVRDQMPRISRFLFGNWLKTSFFEPLTKDAVSSRIGVGYRDSHGATHKRCLSLNDDGMLVVDDISGFKNVAILRWRFIPGSWSLSVINNKLQITNNRNNLLIMNVHATMPIIRAEILDGFESRHYLQKEKIPVLEVEFNQPGIVSTEVRWSA